MRRTVITEDIIRNALNESIDEFMINEEMLQEYNWGNLFKGAWNGLKNAAAAYMDKKTDGRWNQKYNIYVNGNSKYAEMYYLNKWFNWHLKQIQYIAHSGPNRGASDDIMWNKDGTGIQRRNNYNNVEQYVQKNITPDNFNGWAGQYIENRRGLKCIDEYIQDSAKHINNIDSAEQYLNVWNFLNSPKGQEYQKLSGKNLENERQSHQQGVQTKQKAQQQRFIDTQKQQIEHIKERITDCQDFVSNLNIYNNGRVRMNGVNVHWVRWAEETINSLNDIPKETKQWMDEVIARSVNKGPKYAASFLTYDNFISSPYGTKYAQLEQQINGAQQQTQQGQ